MKDHNGVTEQAKAVGHRLADAKALLAEKRWRAAMYLAGYAVECRLKVRLMRKHDCRHLDDLGEEFVAAGRVNDPRAVYTHSLTLLLHWTERQPVLQADRELWAEFADLSRWSSEWRYYSDDPGPDAATDFVASAVRLVDWFENNV